MDYKTYGKVQNKVCKLIKSIDKDMGGKFQMLKIYKNRKGEVSIDLSESRKPVEFK